MIGGFVPGTSDQCLFGGLEVRRRRERIGRKELQEERQAKKGEGVNRVVEREEA